MTPYDELALAVSAEVDSLGQQVSQLRDAHIAGGAGIHERLDEQRRRTDTLLAAQQRLHERLLDLLARVRRVEAALRRAEAAP